MKKTIRVLFLILLIQACSDDNPNSSINSINWEKRTINNDLSDSLITGTSYLSIYSHIYSKNEQRTHDLTATVSIRNMNMEDTLFIHNARYFDTSGELIRSYFEKTIFVAPLETVEIIIEGNDQTGGTGANFLFDWSILPNSNEPLFEGIMISAYGQQGLSFTTTAKRIR